ncbi:TolC family protein [Flavobacteriaceae bacterium S356]|uniref:TolC family protein n=1 Tax=Asprobacillus argus TaxID=3076534 RepID=A0ABU3LEN1_9FLAO|nr:TolC family protein [Flavobacteriaceae bacterium S356]
MTLKNKAFLTTCFVILSFFGTAVGQNADTTVLSFSEYIGYVKKFHPIVKQANLILNEGEAKLMKARGMFDPKLAIDTEKKVFKNTEYYNKLNTTFKIPTWYGVELKANFEQNDGSFLNSEANVPNDGLYSAGISVSLAQGLLINKRMAAVKQAKLFKKQVKADRDILVSSILSEAAKSYLSWLKRYNQVKIYENFLKNAEFRFNSIKRSVVNGDMAAIDSTEARITKNIRKLDLIKSRVQFTQATLELSNFLWLDDRTPLELQAGVTPQVNMQDEIDITLGTSTLNSNLLNLDNHPKIRSLDYKYQILKVDRNLKMNQLLPQVDFQYNFLTESPNLISSYSTTAYKSGLLVRFPLFLRKERGALQFAKIKLQNTKYEIDATRLSIKNKLSGIQSELASFTEQNTVNKTIVEDYEKMLSAEERKFSIGESSLFLVNSRESKLMEARLKAISLENQFFNTKVKLFVTLSNPNN